MGWALLWNWPDVICKQLFLIELPYAFSILSLFSKYAVPLLPQSWIQKLKLSLKDKICLKAWWDRTPAKKHHIKQKLIET